DRIHEMESKACYDAKAAWLQEYSLLVAGAMICYGCLWLLKRELASTGCVSQLLMEDLCLATLLLLPCFLHRFVLRLLANLALGCHDMDIHNLFF
ncbi:unnamed protein product, partial [Symbiodinium pilosum]